MKRALPWIALALVVALVAGIVYITGRNNTSRQGQESATTTVQQAPSSTPADLGGKQESYVWIFTALPEDQATGAPMTNVQITDQVTNETYELGTSMGSCFVAEDTAWGLLEGQESAAICYFAGGGDEYGVYREGDRVMVKKGYVEEGTNEITGGRGGFSTIVTFN